MPEAPDLEVIKEFLNREVQGKVVDGAKVIRPTVLRAIAGDFASDIQGRTFGLFQRKGKFILGELSGDRCLVVKPMLTGALHYCESKVRVLKKTCFVLGVSGPGCRRFVGNLTRRVPVPLDPVPRRNKRSAHPWRLHLGNRQRLFR